MSIVKTKAFLMSRNPLAVAADVRRWQNCTAAYVAKDGRIRISNAGAGRWLTHVELMTFAKWLRQMAGAD